MWTVKQRQQVLREGRRMKMHRKKYNQEMENRYHLGSCLWSLSEESPCPCLEFSWTFLILIMALPPFL